MNNGTSPKQPFMGRAMPQQKVAISKLDMDLQNPRLLVNAASQDDAMRQMLATTGKECMELLKDISEKGQLSSSDLPIVIRDGKRFTVLEGNRRLLCLRLWKKPDIIDRFGEAGEKLKQRATKYRDTSRFTPPTTIDVVVAENREQAEDWIDKKHGLNQNGSGTTEWDAYQKARRKAQRNPDQVPRSLAFVEFLMHEFNNSPDIQSTLTELVEKQFTILDRLWSDQEFRNTLGVEFNGYSVTLKRGKQTTLPVLRKMIQDLASGTYSSRTLNSAAEREKYSETLALEFRQVSDEPSYTSPPNAAPARPNAQPSKTPPQKRTKKRTQQKKIRIFADLEMSSFPERLQNLVEELRKLDISKNVELSSAALRVLLDLSMAHFADVQPHTDKPNGPLWERAKGIIEVLDPTAANTKGPVQNWSPLQELYNRCSEDSMKVLQLGVHSSQMTNTPNEVKGWADRLEPLLVAMNEKLRNNTDS